MPPFTFRPAAQTRLCVDLVDHAFAVPGEEQLSVPGTSKSLAPAMCSASYMACALPANGPHYAP
jgi:hypothetical protein